MSSKAADVTAGDAPRWRLFVAALLSDGNRRALEAPIAELAASAPVVNRTRVDAIHLTLHFLGSVETDRVEELSGGLAVAVAPFTTFPVELTGVGAFPTLNRPRVLWAGVGGAKLFRLRDLQAATGGAVRMAGIVTESRAYAPHLTLGRLRAVAGVPERAAIARWDDRWRDAAFGTLLIDALHLMRSDLSQRPPRYTSLKRFPLQ